MALFHSFWGWVIFHYIYVPHLLYPFIYWWTFKCFHVLAIVNSAAFSIRLHVFLQIIVLSVYMPRSGIAGSYGNSIFSFLRKLNIILHSGCTSLHSYQELKTIPFSPHPLQYLLFLDILMITILWSLNTVGVCSGWQLGYVWVTLILSRVAFKVFRASMK